jgi:transcriptional activator SPT8
MHLGKWKRWGRCGHGRTGSVSERTARGLDIQAERALPCIRNQSQLEPEDNDVDMDQDNEQRVEDEREPIRNGGQSDTTTKLDSARIRTASFSFTSSDTPANVLRRKLFVPSKETMDQHLLLDPFIVIPQPGHVHSLAATPCMSYLLTGSEDGYVRTYDFWASANGKNMLSTQQRAMATLGEGVNKGGVVKGYYKNDVEIEEVVGEEEEEPPLQTASQPAKPAKEIVKTRKMQPVHSLAVQGDGLWALSGTEVCHHSLRLRCLAS